MKKLNQSKIIYSLLHEFQNISHKAFLYESLKITLLCLGVVGLFKPFGASDHLLLIIFYMVATTAAVTFSVEKKHLAHLTLGSFTVVVSIVMGGVIGFYFPWLVQISLIIYSYFVFCLSKQKYQVKIGSMGAVVFLMFSVTPFNLQNGVVYLLIGLAASLIFSVFYWLSDKTKQNQVREKITVSQLKNNHVTAAIAVISLVFAGAIGYIIRTHFLFTHLYWINLTILVVIQNSQQGTITNALNRIFANVIGAIIIMILLNYIMSNAFWINFFIEAIFLFAIFYFSFSSFMRHLFITLFVLSLTYLLGNNYQSSIAVDRILLTLIGGTIVIVVAKVTYYLTAKQSKVINR